MAGRNEIRRRKKARRRQRESVHLARLAADRRFRGSMQRILIALGLPDLFRRLPEPDQNFIIDTRFRAPRIMPAEGVKPPRRVLEIIRVFISRRLKHEMVPVMPGCGTVSLEDYWTAGFTLAIFAQLKNESMFQAVTQAQEQLSAFARTAGKAGTEPMVALLLAANTAGMVVSRVNQTMYYLMPDLYWEGSGLNLRSSTSLVLHQVKPVSRNITVDGKPRPAWKIGWPLAGTGMRWAAVPARYLGIHNAFADLPMEAYIQSHALIRLRERLDCLGYPSQHAGIFHAFHDQQSVPLDDKRALLPFHCASLKLGYFLVEISGGMAVVKTFLFITNSGTPEGERLNRELQIGKIDKEFLRIDRLSSFVCTDMVSDPRVREVFERVGLGYLCNLDPDVFGKRSPLATGYAADFVKYLGLV